MTTFGIIWLWSAIPIAIILCAISIWVFDEPRQSEEREISIRTLPLIAGVLWPISLSFVCIIIVLAIPINLFFFSIPRLLTIAINKIKNREEK